MKRLILLRHGKSSWENNVLDEDRPLQKIAYDDAELVAETFGREANYNFTIWSSKANRAKTTAQLIVEKLEDQVDDFRIKDEFYTFNAAELLKLIFKLPDLIDNMMLVGHNPAFTQLVNYFCETAELGNLPTTGLVEMEFKSDNWSSIREAKINLLLFPKNLR
ncbi:SixA phosphatase family protein [Psychroflexus planctonicus]|uniref:Phosphoglycerate mutase n=1 Tax=Psychroflexus planctonicus TaxID=1526575 RepID=A0ABQ1SF32_9FLAO|nr:histidine phosphatase family protein [Psychroflexus planctonicus]GGE29251.1 phosphoglycerate mutase [Psychroflexus planctonicus]